METNEVQLGQMVKDSITGFAGIATGVTEYITGCRQVLVQPKMHDADKNEFIEARWFDDDRLEVLQAEPIKLAIRRQGFDKPAPRK